MIEHESRNGAAMMLRRPKVVRVSDAIAESLVMAGGAYDADLTPYMREPADMLASRRYKTVCFIGPARTGKTATLIDGWIARTVVHDPGDMLVVQASQDLARYYSKVRIKRMIEASPMVRERLSARRQDDNTFDKVFRSGMCLAFGWPSGAQLSGRDFRYVALTEYDAAADDIDGEGSLFALASKRTETFLSAGKVLVESSVRREYRDSGWSRRVQHEAPPATGITAIYNGGTMCWLYWQCEHCGEWVALDPDVHAMFNLLDLESLAEQLNGKDAAEWARQHAHVACTHCGAEFDESRKRQLNGAARWIPSGCTIDGGTPRDTQTASYQLSCVAAAYQSWRGVLEKYATAIQDYIRTGSETEIKSTVNLDQGRAYLPLAVGKQRAGHELQSRAESWEQGTVPEGVRFLISTIDIQAGRNPRFVVQVMGYGAGLERWVIDRFALRSSERPDGSGGFHPIDPASYAEDWHRLLSKVIERRYPLADGSGRTMPVRMTGCDSGGKAGVTVRAYEFWRWLRGKGMGNKFRLVKGADRIDAPRVQESFPDVRGRADRNSGARGDVPVLICNSTMLKDDVMSKVWRESPGPGYFHFPDWLPTSFYDELTAEVRGDKRWTDTGKPNESLDLSYYSEACAVHLKADRIDWTKPPLWAADWDLNPDVRADDAPQPTRQAPRALIRVPSKSLGR